MGVATIVAACGGSSAVDGPGLSVVTSTAILADLARNVGGGHVEVVSLIPAGSDVHAYQITPRGGVALGGADLVVLNGAGLDDFLAGGVASAAGSSVPVVRASEGLNTRGGDPHFWQDPIAAIAYVERIRDALASANPARAGDFRRNAEAYAEELRGLDADIRAALEAVPPARRVLVTFHDAFGHFGRRYGFEVLPLVGSDGGDLTPRTLAGVLGEVRQRGLPAVFAEPQFGQDALRQAAADAGIAVGAIRSDSLDEETPTYVEMMRANARSIAAMLGSTGDMGRKVN